MLGEGVGLMGGELVRTEAVGMPVEVVWGR